MIFITLLDVFLGMLFIYILVDVTYPLLFGGRVFGIARNAFKPNRDKANNANTSGKKIRSNSADFNS